jgi:hypothetical protein
LRQLQFIRWDGRLWVRFGEVLNGGLGQKSSPSFGHKKSGPGTMPDPLALLASDQPIGATGAIATATWTVS